MDVTIAVVGADSDPETVTQERPTVDFGDVREYPPEAEVDMPTASETGVVANISTMQSDMLAGIDVKSASNFDVGKGTSGLEHAVDDPRSTQYVANAKRMGRLSADENTDGGVENIFLEAGQGDEDRDQEEEGGVRRGSGLTNKSVAKEPSTLICHRSHDFRVMVHRVGDLLEDQRGPPTQRRENLVKLQREMADMLQLTDYESDLDECIVLDVFVAGLRWAADAYFQPLQATLFLHLLQHLFAAIETNPSFENIVEKLHSHVYNETFFDAFQEAEVYFFSKKH